jgi:hypothetical protein
MSVSNELRKLGIFVVISQTQQRTQYFHFQTVSLKKGLTQPAKPLSSTHTTAKAESPDRHQSQHQHHLQW